jgi:DNA-binding PadR family transcriptional regulator
MPIKHAVLGLLLERPGYGYELMQRLERRLEPAWQLNPSTVYAALERLEGEALIASRGFEGPATGARARGEARRVVYEATSAGRREFELWIGRPSERIEPVRGELQLKLAAAREQDVPALLDAIDHAELLARMLWEECRGRAPADAVGAVGAVGAASVELIQMAAMSRLEGELRWLQTVRRCLKRSRPHPGGEGQLRYGQSV